MADYSYHDLYMAAKQALRKVDGENAEFTAREIVAAATDRTVSQLVADFQLTIFQRDIKRVNEMVERHLKGEPLAYILGQWEFYGLSLTVTPDVLIPRDDTEAVCDLAIHQVKLGVQNPRVLDLCTGTGCIGLAIASKVKDARVTLGEISPEALRIAKKNTQDNHLSGRVSCISLDVRQPAPKYLGKYDLIVSNPPYIRTSVIQELQEEVRLHDPFIALDGKEDGLYFYREIIKAGGGYLKPGGYLMFEIGYDQGTEVASLMEKHGYRNIMVKKDLAGLDRVVSGMYNGE